MDKKKDSVQNWYEVIPKEFRKAPKKDPTYPEHLIKPCSMILTVGPTGVGKSNSVVEFLKRKNNHFYEIIVFTGSSTDEPLYNFLKSAIQGIEMIDEVGKLPNIDVYKDSENKDLEKLIIFDDSVMNDKKELKQICKWFMCARKWGFTCMFLSQDFTSTPIFLRRQINYLQLFKLQDTNDERNILKKCATDVTATELHNMLVYATANKLNFLTIALSEIPSMKYRKDFIEVLDPKDFQ
jgi:hypothetical protein